MSDKKLDSKNCDLSFTKGTVYEDMRHLNGNAFVDIKMSLNMGTSSEIIYYLKKNSKLLQSCTGDEPVRAINKGVFSQVYLLEREDEEDLIVKKSHDEAIPFSIGKTSYIKLPRFIVNLVYDDYDIGPRSLKRDIDDYEKVIKPFWGPDRKDLEGEYFRKYINLILHMVDDYLPDFETEDIYNPNFWNRILKKDDHPKLDLFIKELKKYKGMESLIPKEERYIFYDSKSNSLQTIFLQEAKNGTEEILPGKKMAYPYQLVSEGVIFSEMPRHMIDHFIRVIDTFIIELRDDKYKIAKVPDYRPHEAWKVLPPSPVHQYLSETSNLVAHKDEEGQLNVTFVDTHILLEKITNTTFLWVQKRYWESLFMNLRFWFKKILEKAKSE